MTCTFLQTGTVLDAPLGSGPKWDEEEAQPLLDHYVPPFWYLPTGSLAQATNAVKGTFPPPELPDALLCSPQVREAWVRWRESGRLGPYFLLAQGQALLHAEGMVTVECRAVVPDTARRWIMATAPHPMRPPAVCHHLLRTVPPLALLPSPHPQGVAGSAGPLQGLDDGPSRTLPNRAGA